jgi:hypothetical protein
MTRSQWGRQPSIKGLFLRLSPANNPNTDSVDTMHSGPIAILIGTESSGSHDTWNNPTNWDVGVEEPVV